MRCSRRAAVLLAMVYFLAAEVSANPSAVGGNSMRCSINGYMWPASADAAPIATDLGTMEIESDGHGKFVSGQMTQHLADDTHMAGTEVCTFDLESGSYVQHSDGTTANTIAWKLRPGSDPHCGAIASGNKNLGFVEGSRDLRSFTYASTSYALDGGRIGYVAASALGISIGVCEPVKK